MEGRFLKYYIDYASSQTDAPAVFHNYVGLTIAGAALGNRVIIPSWGADITPAIWTMLLAPSGFYRKSTAVKIGQRILARALPDSSMPEEFSPEKLVARLATDPSGIFVAPEFGNLLGMLKRDYMAGARELITDFFDSPESYTRTTGKDGKVTIKRPALSFLVATTLDWLQERMSLRDMRGGLFARFLFVVGREKDGAMYAPPSRNFAVEDSLADYLKALGEVGRDKPLRMDLDAVMPRFRDFMQGYEEGINARQTDGDLQGVFTRTGIYVLKLATVIHHCHVTGDPYVCPNDLEAAIENVLASQQEVERVWAEDMTRDKDDAEMRKVMAAIERLRVIDRAALLRATHLTAAKLDIYTKTLVDAERIDVTEQRTKGRPALTYSVHVNGLNGVNGISHIVHVKEGVN